MTVQQIIDRVWSNYEHGMPSNDSRLRPRYIYELLKSGRSTLVKRELKKRNTPSDWVYQSLKCVTMEKVPIQECPCIPPVGCNILRSKYKLPQPIFMNNPLRSVTSLDGSVEYSPTTWDELKYSSSNTYTAGRPEYFVRDGYLYITDKKTDTTVFVSGVFHDPVEVGRFNNYCEDECFSALDQEFPMPEDLIGPMIELSFREGGMFIQSREDRKADATDAYIQDSVQGGQR